MKLAAVLAVAYLAVACAQVQFLKRGRGDHDNDNCKTKLPCDGKKTCYFSRNDDPEKTWKRSSDYLKISAADSFNNNKITYLKDIDDNDKTMMVLTAEGSREEWIKRTFTDLPPATAITLVAGFFRDKKDIKDVAEVDVDIARGSVIATVESGNAILSRSDLDFDLTDDPDLEKNSWSGWNTFVIYTSFTSKQDVTIKFVLQNKDAGKDYVLIDHIALCETKPDLCPRDCPKGLYPYSCAYTKECELYDPDVLCRASVVALDCDGDPIHFDPVKDVSCSDSLDDTAGGGYTCTFVQPVPACKKDGKGEGENLVGDVPGDGNVKPSRALRGKGKMISRKATEVIEEQRLLEGFCAKGYVARADHANNSIHCIPAASSALVDGRRTSVSVCGKDEDEEERKRNPYKSCKDFDCDSFCPPGQYPTKCVCAHQYRETRDDDYAPMLTEKGFYKYCHDAAKQHNNECIRDKSCPCGSKKAHFKSTTCKGGDYNEFTCFVLESYYMQYVALQKMSGNERREDGGRPRYAQCIMDYDYTNDDSCKLDCGVCTTEVECDDCVYRPNDDYKCKDEDGFEPPCHDCKRRKKHSFDRDDLEENYDVGDKLDQFLEDILGKTD